MKKRVAKKRARKSAKPSPPKQPAEAKQMSLAEKISNKELSNALARLNAGKNLTSREAKIVDEFKASQTKGDTGKYKAEFPQEDTVQNAKAAADRIGCTMDELKLARAMSCDAFGTGNRISISRLAAFLKTPEFKSAASAPPEMDDAKAWDARLKRAKALQAEHRLKVEEGRAWDAEQAMQLLGAANSAMLDTLKRFLESEQPPLVEGKSAGQILKLNQQFYDQLVREMRSGATRAVEKLGETLAEDED